MESRARALLAIVTAAVVGALAVSSCQTATQITVYVEGRGFECETGQSGDHVSHVETGVVARSVLKGATDVAAIGALGTDCKANDGILELGSVVLTPGDDPGAVEVLAVGALRTQVGEDVSSTSVDECLASYQSFLGSDVDEGTCEGACALCIFARRSLGFVENSKLTLRIELDNDCAGVLCGASLTCLQGECVSAQTVCEGDECELEVGDGVGGGGGSGDGGAGGGNGPWTSLATESDPDIDAYDVFGAAVDGSSYVFVAADTHMFEIVDGVLAHTYPGPGMLAETYRAVGVPQGSISSRDLDQVVAFGRLGVSSRENAFLDPSVQPPFGGIPIQYAIGSASPGAWEWGVGFNATQGQSTLQTGTNPVGIAIAAASPSVYYAAFKGAIGVFEEGEAPVLLSGGSSTQWSIWASADDSGTYAIANDGRAARMDMIEGQAPTQATSSEAIDATIVDIWGEPRIGASVSLWAVGRLRGAPWLGRAQIPRGGGVYVWQRFALPDAMTSSEEARAVWVGAGKVFIGGSPGVFEADIAELEATLP